MGVMVDVVVVVVLFVDGDVVVIDVSVVLFVLNGGSLMVLSYVSLLVLI